MHGEYGLEKLNFEARVFGIWSFGALELLLNPLVLLSPPCFKSLLQPRLRVLVGTSIVQVLVESSLNVFPTRDVQLSKSLEVESGSNTKISMVKSSSESLLPRKTKLQTPAKAVRYLTSRLQQHAPSAPALV
ncbi:hypothetical protein BPAE_0022g00010 [Botrytis paeoniae]|uniref:Uncharacterized protein n=1 Tax=Botrytis paeoniae TaxID=278948 RepID=A0A4Z1FW07_9HELO|nr:hypothetical protein BPAE_0022g00010 [Botrytis paeoniae]